MPSSYEEANGTFLSDEQKLADLEQEEPSGRKIVALCDGTWCGESHTESNIEILFKMFKSGAFTVPVPEEDICYFDGIGVQDDTAHYLINGALALTIDVHILETYKFIATRYNAHMAQKRSSEVWLFGLSRGAYTVRAVAGMIHNFGILRDPTEKNCRAIYDLYRNPDEQYHPDSAFSRALRSKLSYTKGKHETPIRFMGLFDTVGALGIPKIVDGEHFGYSLYDTVVGSSVQYVCQATSIHDRLSFFQPCSISRTNSSKAHGHGTLAAPHDHNQFQSNLQEDVPTIEECLLPGCHYDLGRQEFVPWRKDQGLIVDGLTSALDSILDGIDYFVGRPGALAATRVKPDHYFADHALNYILNRACQVGLDPARVQSYFQAHPDNVSPKRSLVSRLPNPFRGSKSERNASFGIGDVYDLVPFSSFLRDRALPIRCPEQSADLSCYGNVVELKEPYVKKSGEHVDLVAHLKEVPWEYKSEAMDKYEATIDGIEDYRHDSVRYANFKKMVRNGKSFDYAYRNFKRSP